MKQLCRALFVALALCAANVHAELITWRMTAEQYDPQQPNFTFDIALDPASAFEDPFGGPDPSQARQFFVPSTLTVGSNTYSIPFLVVTSNFLGDVMVNGDHSGTSFYILLFGGGFQQSLEAALDAVTTRTEAGIPSGVSGLFVGLTIGNETLNGFGVDFQRVQAAAVPEPQSLALLLGALGIMGATMRKRRA